MIDRSRRNFLKTSAGAAGRSLIGPAALTSAFADVPKDSSGKLEPFPLSSVRLAAGIFSEQEQINASYLDSLAVNQLLHSFRITAGISSSATPYKGWEDPTCELRGHFAGGHFLSAVALAFAGSGNTVLKSRGDEARSRSRSLSEEDGNRLFERFPH